MIDTSLMKIASTLTGGESEVGLDLTELAAEAREFVVSHPWCGGVKGLYYDRGFPKVAVFLADIEPLGSADPQVWIVVGDIPPLFLDIEDHRNGAEALAGYLLVFYWYIALYSRGKPLADVPPLLTRGSLLPMQMDDKLASMIRGRLNLIRKRLLELWKADIQYNTDYLTEEAVLAQIDDE